MYPTPGKLSGCVSFGQLSLWGESGPIPVHTGLPRKQACELYCFPCGNVICDPSSDFSMTRHLSDVIPLTGLPSFPPYLVTLYQGFAEHTLSLAGLRSCFPLLRRFSRTCKWHWWNSSWSWMWHQGLWTFGRFQTQSFLLARSFGLALSLIRCWLLAVWQPARGQAGLHYFIPCVHFRSSSSLPQPAALKAKAKGILRCTFLRFLREVQGVLSQAGTWTWFAFRPSVQSRIPPQQRFLGLPLCAWVLKAVIHHSAWITKVFEDSILLKYPEEWKHGLTPTPQAFSHPQVDMKQINNVLCITFTPPVASPKGLN